MSTTDFLSLAREIGPELAARAAECDANDEFVSENFATLKEKGFFTAHVPEALGGGGASHAEMCVVLREIGHHCSSTALSFSMHTHLVAAATWRWNHGDTGGEGLLKRVAAENLVLVSSGGSDWLDSSGKVEKTEGGTALTPARSFPADRRLAISSSLPQFSMRPTAQPSYTSRYRCARRAFP